MSATLNDMFGASPGERVYRAYRLSASGRVEGVEHIDARSDEEASTLTAVIASGHGLDLWERARFLGHFRPLRATAADAKG